MNRNTSQQFLELAMKLDFQRLVADSLKRQAEAIGKERLADHRLCALCLRYTPRATYNEHMQQAHGYTTLEIEP